jgi:hypothetical protein
MRGRYRRPQDQRLAITRNGFIEPAGPLKGIAEVVVRIGKIGLQSDRMFKTGNCCVILVQVASCYAEIVLGAGHIGMQGYRTRAAFGRLPDVLQLLGWFRAGTMPLRHPGFVRRSQHIVRVPATTPAVAALR